VEWSGGLSQSGGSGGDEDEDWAAAVVCRVLLHVHLYDCVDVVWIDVERTVAIFGRLLNLIQMDG